MATWNDLRVGWGDDWEAQIKSLLEGLRPDPAGGLFGALSGGTDFYVWARADKNGPAYGVDRIYPEGNPGWLDTIRIGIKKRTIVPIGFNCGLGAGNALWYFEADKRPDNNQQDWVSFHVGVGDEAWKDKLERFLNQTTRPQGGLGNVFGALSGGTDFYLWARKDLAADASKYKIQSMSIAEYQRRKADILLQLRMESFIPIGFNCEHGDRNTLWYISVE
jgi:hypothetical protein